jgi:hypothetical protein
VLVHGQEFWEVGSHAPNGRDFSFPTLVSPGVHTHAWTTTNLKDPAVEHARRRVESGDLRIVLTPTSLQAYLESSQRVASLVRHLNSLGVEVTGPGILDRAVAMLQFGGIMSVHEVEDMMSTAQSWSEALLSEARQTPPEWAEPGSKPMLDSNGIVLQILIASKPALFTAKALRDDFHFGDPEHLLAATRRVLSNQRR